MRSPKAACGAASCSDKAALAALMVNFACDKNAQPLAGPLVTYRCIPLVASDTKSMRGWEIKKVNIADVKYRFLPRMRRLAVEEFTSKICHKDINWEWPMYKSGSMDFAEAGLEYPVTGLANEKDSDAASERRAGDGGGGELAILNKPTVIARLRAAGKKRLSDPKLLLEWMEEAELATEMAIRKSPKKIPLEDPEAVDPRFFCSDVVYASFARKENKEEIEARITRLLSNLSKSPFAAGFTNEDLRYLHMLDYVINRDDVLYVAHPMHKLYVRVGPALHVRSCLNKVVELLKHHSTYNPEACDWISVELATTAEPEYKITTLAREDEPGWKPSIITRFLLDGTR